MGPLPSVASGAGAAAIASGAGASPRGPWVAPAAATGPAERSSGPAAARGVPRGVGNLQPPVPPAAADCLGLLPGVRGLCCC